VVDPVVVGTPVDSDTLLRITGYGIVLDQILVRISGGSNAPPVSVYGVVTHLVTNGVSIDSNPVSVFIADHGIVMYQIIVRAAADIDSIVDVSFRCVEPNQVAIGIFIDTYPAGSVPVGRIAHDDIATGAARDVDTPSQVHTAGGSYYPVIEGWSSSPSASNEYSSIVAGDVTVLHRVAVGPVIDNDPKATIIVRPTVLDLIVVGVAEQANPIENTVRSDDASDSVVVGAILDEDSVYKTTDGSVCDGRSAMAVNLDAGL
jgi:hypothetical protein